MTTGQPSNAPQNDAPKPHDDLSAASVVNDDRLDAAAGGGGLGGQSAAEGDPQRTGAQGGTMPSTPQDLGITSDDIQGNAAAEARTQADTAEPHPGSQ